MAKDMRSYLRDFRERFPDQYVEIDRPVDPIYELPAVQKKLARAGRHPILQFSNVKGSAFPVVCNLYATRQHMAFALGAEEQALPDFYRQAEDNPIDPVMVQDAPSQEIVLTGDEVDLTRLPVCKSHGPDIGPYLTATLVLANDPESGAHNVSFGRLQLAGKDTCYTHITPGRHLHIIHTTYEQRQEPLPVSVNIGLHPAWALGGTSLVPLDFDELRVAGGLAGEPVRVARCRTVAADCLADCEMVLEGYILPHERGLEGPFCEFPGYSTGQRMREVFRVTAVTMRRGALYQHITASSNDHRLLGAVGKESRLFKVARAAAPTVTGVHMPLSGCGRFHCYVSLDQRTPGMAKQVGLAVLGADIYTKTVVVLDHDIDIFDDSEVMWAIATRVQFDRDVHLIPGARGSDLDPSVTADGIVCKTIIDATAKPTLAEFKPRALVPKEVWDRVDLDDYLPAPAKAGRS